MYCPRSDARGYATPSAEWSIYLGCLGTRYLPTCRYVKSTGKTKGELRRAECFSRLRFRPHLSVIDFAMKWLYLQNEYIPFFNKYIYRHYFILLFLRYNILFEKCLHLQKIIPMKNFIYTPLLPPPLSLSLSYMQ